jgi:hypothetical protein
MHGPCIYCTAQFYCSYRTQVAQILIPIHAYSFILYSVLYCNSWTAPLSTQCTRLRPTHPPARPHLSCLPINQCAAENSTCSTCTQSRLTLFAASKTPFTVYIFLFSTNSHLVSCRLVSLCVQYQKSPKARSHSTPFLPSCVTSNTICFTSVRPSPLPRADYHTSHGQTLTYPHRLE